MGACFFQELFFHEESTPMHGPNLPTAGTLLGHRQPISIQYLSFFTPEVSRLLNFANPFIFSWWPMLTPSRSFRLPNAKPIPKILGWNGYRSPHHRCKGIAGAFGWREHFKLGPCAIMSSTDRKTRWLALRYDQNDPYRAIGGNCQILGWRTSFWKVTGTVARYSYTYQGQWIGDTQYSKISSQLTPILCRIILPHIQALGFQLLWEVCHFWAQSRREMPL